MASVRVGTQTPAISAIHFFWIRTSVSKEQSKDVPLFKYKRNHFATLLHEASIKSIGRHINIHLLRHSGATWLKQNGFDLVDIATLLGHSSISTTQIYAHISNEQLGEKYQKLFKGDKK